MGTQKRERQKENRAKKIETQQKQLKRDLTKDRLIIFVLCAVAVVAAVGLWVFFGDNSSVEEPTPATQEPVVPEQPLPTQPAETDTDTTL